MLKADFKLIASFVWREELQPTVVFVCKHYTNYLRESDEMWNKYG